MKAASQSEAAPAASHAAEAKADMTDVVKKRPFEEDDLPDFVEEEPAEIAKDPKLPRTE